MRSLSGAEKNCSGDAVSTISPASMNTMVSATLRAKLISWVTQTIVMPSSASSTMTSKTSEIISGSRAEVGSSNSMMRGSMQSERAMATRCCWPPESCAGYFSACSGMCTRSRYFRARASASAGFILRARTFSSRCAPSLPVASRPSPTEWWCRGSMR